VKNALRIRRFACYTNNMSNSFLPEQPALEDGPEKAPELSPAIEAIERDSELDEYAKAELEAEKAFAEKIEKEKGFLGQAEEGNGSTAQTATQAQTDQAPAMPKDEVMTEVQSILQEGLAPLYATLPPDAKLRFQAKGLEVSTSITDMVKRFRVNTKKVLLLIRDWLLTIPSVNKFFLEQEAKIKTDKIVILEQARKEDQQHTPL